MKENTRSRGFASMDSEKQREIARKGGRAAHEKGTAHEFTPDEARDAGRKGGERVSHDRKHMADIGRMGGKSSAARRRTTKGPGEMGGPEEPLTPPPGHAPEVAPTPAPTPEAGPQMTPEPEAREGQEEQQQSAPPEQHEPTHRPEQPA